MDNRPPHVVEIAGSDRSGRPSVLDLAVLMAVVAVGAVNLAQPFGWDQSIFAIIARRMHDGAVLYRDVWDVKQPGLFVFYLAGGSLFGFSEVGIHAFEILYWLACSWLLQRCLRRVVTHAWVASLAPLFVVGFYYAFAGDWHLTQAEGLAGFPLAFTLWFAYRAAGSGPRAARPLFWSGLCGGLVLMLKLLFAPIPAAFWLMALAAIAAEAGVAAAFSGALAIAAGAALPFAVAAVYFAAQGQLGLAWWTNVVYPLQLSPVSTRVRLPWLAGGFSWFALRWGALVALSGLAWARPAERARFSLRSGLVVWIALGAVVILSQRLSWWEYHYLLITPAIGLLAALGVDAFASLIPAGQASRGLPRQVAAPVFVVALACAPALAVSGLKLTYFALDGFALTEAGRRAEFLRYSRGNAYGKILDEVRPLSEPGAVPGRIHVMGNPLFHWLSNRDPVLPRFGGILARDASRREWEQVARGLHDAHPPYIFTERATFESLNTRTERSQPFLDFLESEYRPVRETRMGFWWAPRTAAPPAGTARAGEPHGR